MATTSFHMVIGARMRFTAFVENRTATFRLSGGPLMRFDPYGSASFSRAAKQNAKAWLPPRHIPVTDAATGLMTEEWYRYHEYMANQRMGGINGPSMGEVQTNVVETKAAAVQAVVAASAISEVVVANAEALKATVEVTQTNALSGSDQIPEVIVRTAYKRDTFA